MLIPSSIAETAGVAERHDHSATPIALSWELIRSTLHTRLIQRGFTIKPLDRYMRLFSDIVSRLPTSPELVKKHDLASLYSHRSHKEMYVPVISHMILIGIDLGIWPREFLQQRVGTKWIRRELAPTWQIFLAKYPEYLKSQSILHLHLNPWQKWITVFLWWSRPSVEEPMDPEWLKGHWHDFNHFLDKAWKPMAYRHTWWPRAFAIFWNFAIDSGMLRAEPLPMLKVGTRFWEGLQDHLRPALRLLIPSKLDNPLGGQLRPRLLVYTLIHLNFSYYGKTRYTEVSEEEIAAIQRKLQAEAFSQESIIRVLGDVRYLNRNVLRGVK